jgi:GNAT superfamily N-acetyltransferase
MASKQKTLVRPLTRDDLDAVVRIDLEQSGRARREFFARRLCAPAGEAPALVAVAAERGARLVGFAFAHLLDGEFGAAAPVGVLDAIGVVESLQREGLATALLAALEQTLAERGVRVLRTQADWTELGMAGFFSAKDFRLAPRVVLERALDRPVEGDLEAEEIPVRSMTEADLPEIVRVDGKITGRDRGSYLRRKADEVLRRSAVRVSLVAELEGQLAGFLMARVDFGEFGRTEPTAVLDTIGVNPAYAGRGVGRALVEQLLRNVASLRAEQVVTEVEWGQLPLLGFLAKAGFGHSQRLAFDKAIA